MLQLGINNFFTIKLAIQQDMKSLINKVKLCKSPCTFIPHSTQLRRIISISTYLCEFKENLHNNIKFEGNMPIDGNQNLEDVSNHLKCPTIVTFFITNCSNKLPCLPTAFISSQQWAKIIHNGWYEYISSSNSNGRLIHQSIAEERMEGSWRNQIEKSSNGKDDVSVN